VDKEVCQTRARWLEYARGSLAQASQLYRKGDVAAARRRVAAAEVWLSEAIGLGSPVEAIREEVRTVDVLMEKLAPYEEVSEDVAELRETIWKKMLDDYVKCLMEVAERRVAGRSGG